MKKNTVPSHNKKKKSASPRRPQGTTVRKLANYYGLFFWRNNVMNEELAKAIAQDYFDWACKEESEAITIIRFLKLRGIPEPRWSDWKKKYPILEETAQHVKLFIGDNREVGMLKKTLSERGVLKSMSLYNQDWAQLEERIAKLARSDKEGFDKMCIVINDLMKGKEASELP